MTRLIDFDLKKNGRPYHNFENLRSRTLSKFRIYQLSIVKMKIIPAFVSFFIATASAIEDPDVVEETVQISSGCRGVKWGKLTPAKEA